MLSNPSTRSSENPGNDTIDPYPLFPGEARKILIVKKDIFEELQSRYRAFYKGVAKGPGKELHITRPKESVVVLPRPTRPRVLPYEPSPALSTYDCEYRRWCRVNEWFAEFRSDNQKFETAVLIQ